MLRKCVIQFIETKNSFGIVGLGEMGSRIAPNLLRNPNCHKLNVFDSSRSSLNILSEQVKKNDAVFRTENMKKLHICTSPSDLASRSSVIMTVLPNATIVTDVYQNSNNGLFTTASEGTLFVESSTIGPKCAQHLASMAAARNMDFVDAPLSGGAMAAAAGKLTFMVGAGVSQNNDSSKQDATQHEKATKAFERAYSFIYPYLAHKVVFAGPVGSGNVARICNNLLLAASAVAVSEAFVIADKYKLDNVRLNEIINASSGKCWVTEKYHPVPSIPSESPAANGYFGGFKTNLMLKDLNLLIGTSEELNVDAEFTKYLAGFISRAIGHSEIGNLDFTSIIKHIRSKYDLVK